MGIDYYAGRANDDGNDLAVAYHFDVAADLWTNAAGKTLKQCLTEDPSAGPTKSIVVGLSQTEQGKLDTRDLLEVVEKADFHPVDLDIGGRQAWVEARARTLQSTMRQTLHARYWAWGFAGTVT